MPVLVIQLHIPAPWIKPTIFSGWLCPECQIFHADLARLCISASVLLSMKKNKMCNVFIILSKLSAKVKTAFCVCPAGLSS